MKAALDYAVFELDGTVEYKKAASFGIKKLLKMKKKRGTRRVPRDRTTFIFEIW